VATAAAPISQFSRQFHAIHGTSPYRYSVMRRLDVARGWLRDARP
jgi:AraC-like DNA-binding protein